MMFLAIAAAFTATPAADPIAPAWSGQVQCFMPDEAHKQCGSIGIYRRGQDGEILNEAIVAIAKSPVIIMQTVAPVEIKNGLICGVIASADVEKSMFSVDGADATDEQAASLKQSMSSAMQPLFGHEVCTSPAGEAFVDGAHVPQMDQPVRWVPADGGYSVRMP